MPCPLLRDRLSFLYLVDGFRNDTIDLKYIICLLVLREFLHVSKVNEKFSVNFNEDV